MSSHVKGDVWRVLLFAGQPLCSAVAGPQESTAAAASGFLGWWWERPPVQASSALCTPRFAAVGAASAGLQLAERVHEARCYSRRPAASTARLTLPLPRATGRQLTTMPWLKDLVRAPAAEDPPALKERLRPLIYVYDLPAEYNQRLLQVPTGPADTTHLRAHSRPRVACCARQVCTCAFR
jgi:hypothetical protein